MIATAPAILAEHETGSTSPKPTVNVTMKRAKARPIQVLLISLSLRAASADPFNAAR